MVVWCHAAYLDHGSAQGECTQLHRRCVQGPAHKQVHSRQHLQRWKSRDQGALCWLLVSSVRLLGALGLGGEGTLTCSLACSTTIARFTRAAVLHFAAMMVEAGLTAHCCTALLHPQWKAIGRGPLLFWLCAADVTACRGACLPARAPVKTQNAVHSQGC